MFFSETFLIGRLSFFKCLSYKPKL